MNDDLLKKGWSDMRIPPYEESVKQQALHVAMSEFDVVQKEFSKKKNEKSVKGSFWSRFIGKTVQVGEKQKAGSKPYYGGIIMFSIIILFVFDLDWPYFKSESPTSGWTQYSENNSNKPKASIFLRAIDEPLRIVRYDSSTPKKNNAKYTVLQENPIIKVSNDPISTFSIDVDTVSYSMVRNLLNRGAFPPKNMVRIEEILNYFDYSWPVPQSKEIPFKPTVVISHSPWKKGNKLIHIGIKGYDIEANETPHSNLVFLLDVSGSMQSPDKLPLVKNSLRLLLNGLNPEDTVAIVAYAGSSGTVLEPTRVKNRTKILTALERLSAGGSTAGSKGIKLAYALASENFDENAVNRIILATDGDFNVGITDAEELKNYIAQKRKSGIFLSVLGFGSKYINDEVMQALAQNGNGTASYIDTLSEARKVLIEEASSTLFTIAKDVKIQVEFNPQMVAEYRLIGYETRRLQHEDFNNDRVDAGDVGAGHTLTAIYEITPKTLRSRWNDKSRYQKELNVANKTDFSDEYAFLKMRYKLPNSDRSTLITTAITVKDENSTGIIANEAGWTTAVAGFAQLLKGSKFTEDMNYDAVIALAQRCKGEDRFGYRAEFINLVRLTKSLSSLNK